MDNVNIFADLLATPYGALFLGVCLTIGSLSSALSIGYYSIFRYPALLYFALSVVTTYLAFGLASPNPFQILNILDPPEHMLAQQLLNIASAFFFYKVVKASFVPAPTLPFPDYTFDILAGVFLVVKLSSVFYPHPLTFKIDSMLAILFLSYSALIALTFPASTSTMRLIKVGCAVPSAAVLAYPLVRAGAISPNFMTGKMSFLLMGAMALHSVLWFVGLVELAREAREKAQLNMARTLVHLRDFMEAPLDTIQTSIAALQRGDESMLPALNSIDKSVNSLRLVKTLLSRFEKNVPQSKMNGGA